MRSIYRAPKVHFTTFSPSPKTNKHSSFVFSSKCKLILDMDVSNMKQIKRLTTRWFSWDFCVMCINSFSVTLVSHVQLFRDLVLAYTTTRCTIQYMSGSVTATSRAICIPLLNFNESKAIFILCLDFIILLMLCILVTQAQVSGVSRCMYTCRNQNQNS